MDEAKRPPSPAGEPDAEALSKKPVVILIEDEPEIRRFLRASLIGHGYRLFEATTGAEGLREAESRQPDIVVLDLGLPDIDGWEVARRLKGDDETRAIPIIAFSGRSMQHEQVSALRAGCDVYLTKPCAPDKLLGAVRKLLGMEERTASPEEDQPDPY